MKVFGVMCVVTMASVCSTVYAQTAYRCEVNGATVYSEKPCADGKSVAPTQDSDAQKQRAADAGKQLKADEQAVDRKIAERQRLEASERDSQRKAAKKSDGSSNKQTKTKPRERHAKSTKIKITKSKAAKRQKVKSKSENRSQTPK
jgi:hypothetical protein